MNKVSTIKLIVKLYFFGAIAGSFADLIIAGHKLDMGGIRPYTVPFMVDGIAIIGLIMRSDDFASSTRKIGFWTQVIAGTLSLAGNVFAADTLGGKAWGIGIVALFLFAEFLSDRIKTRNDEEAANALAEAQARKQAAIEKGKRTKAANARKRRQEIKTLESMVAGK